MVVAKTDFKLPKIPPKPMPMPVPAPMPGQPPNFPGCGQDHVMQEKLEQMLDGAQHAKLDGNGDGKLNRDEFNAGETGKFAQIFAGKKFDRYDKDNDGYVTKDEFHAGKETERNMRRKGTLELPTPGDIKKLPGTIGEIGKDAIQKLPAEIGEAAQDAAAAIKKLVD